ncbi:L-alanine-DL-glutamate epimerase-like enolase superfamily enzyme [Variibacter gotjawalensis]|nr:L-alanine-DL-glutamate epimerase-like enolase superfamily enzyme [Variibacter gotjawalensis]
MSTLPNILTTGAMATTLKISVERWPIAGSFTIARGSKTEAVVVVAELADGAAIGRGECVPYARYGETVESVSAALEGIRDVLAGPDPRAAAKALPAGAARNALDCALWDLEAKRTGKPAYELAKLPAPRALTTAYTLSLGTPEAMASAAAAARDRPLLKIKLGSDGDPERLAAIRAAAPQSELIVDANEGWRADNLEGNLAACVAAGVTLVEQPLHASDDAPLQGWDGPVAICADESVHDRASLAGLVGRYTAVNIKLDKTGGLTEALAMAAEAERLGFSIMVGCMLATSLSMAPAMLVAQRAKVVDLDGPLLLQRDRPHGLVYRGSIVEPPTRELWG